MRTNITSKIFYAIAGFAALIGISAIQPAQATPARSGAGVLTNVEAPVEQVKQKNRGRHLGWSRGNRKAYGHRRGRSAVGYNRGYRSYERSRSYNRSGAYRNRGYENQGRGLGVNLSIGR